MLFFPIVSLSQKLELLVAEDKNLLLSMLEATSITNTEVMSDKTAKSGICSAICFYTGKQKFHVKKLPCNLKILYSKLKPLLFERCTIDLTESGGKGN